MFPLMLGLYAFGLEECNLYPQAEDIGRRAMAGDARVPWAVHAVAHVMEMQGRFEDGAMRCASTSTAGPRATAPATCGGAWACSPRSAGRAPGVQRLVDAHLSGPALQTTLQRVDAAALLWRMHPLDVDVGALRRVAARLAAPTRTRPATTPSTDLHVLGRALLGADELLRAEG
ncbi:MAG: hypothetical protein U1F53_12305 [Burkholderiaceae bacterium]